MIEKEYFGESRNIEFKREIPSNHEKFLKDIIAFSNTTGGKVIIGIDDKTQVVYGIGDASPFKLSDAISNMISDACTPQIEPDISIQTIENKTLLVVDVPSGKFRPYYIAAKGKETSTYIRINGTSRPADVRKLQELELEG
ncbi:MAG: ATP-binding protein [Bacteroidales bacterium]|nr:ATP-binding protein [Bacteroidales bacterium]MCM1422263.1 ATP-binding protein [bacterium]